MVRPTKKDAKRKVLKKNPLKNLNAMLKLNPYAKTARRVALLTEAQRVKSKKEKLDKKRTPVPKVMIVTNYNVILNQGTLRFLIKITILGIELQEEAAAIKAAGKNWYKTMISDSDYTDFENFSKWLGVTQ